MPVALVDARPGQTLSVRSSSGDSTGQEDFPPVGDELARAEIDPSGYLLVSYVDAGLAAHRTAAIYQHWDYFILHPAD